jgi:hypothetical protein
MESGVNDDEAAKKKLTAPQLKELLKQHKDSLIQQGLSAEAEAIKMTTLKKAELQDLCIRLGLVEAPTVAPTVPKTKVKGFNRDALQAKLREYNATHPAEKIKFFGSHQELSEQCFSFGLITQAERDAPPPRERAQVLDDAERKALRHKTFGTDTPIASPMVTTCTRLAKVVLRQKSSQVIAGLVKDAVLRMHALTVQATHLLRQWLIERPDAKRCAAVLKDGAYRVALEVVSSEGTPENNDGPDAKIRKQLLTIYGIHFEPLLPSNVKKTSRHRLAQMICLEEERLAAAVKTNIKEHFYQHMARFVNEFHDVKGSAPPTSDKVGRKAHFAKFADVKKDLLAGEGAEMLTSDPTLVDFVNEWRQILPSGPYGENSMVYDAHVRPGAYLPALVAMVGKLRAIEKKAFQVLPLRLANTPAYATVDTKALEELTETHRPKGDRLTYDRKIEIWSRFLSVKASGGLPGDDVALHKMSKTFRRGKQSMPRYVFRGSIATDGVGISIGLVRVDLHDLKGIDGPWKAAATANDKATKASIPNIDDMKGKVDANLLGRKYVVVDPGKRDLHYAMDPEEKKNHLRYTQATRRSAMKTKRYNTIRDELHAKKGKLGGKTVSEWNESLSQLDSRSVDMSVFKEWIKGKLESVAATARHWQDESFRRLKFNAKANARRSEDTYLNKFKDAFGDETQRVVIVGDWSQGTGHLKHSPPTMRRGLVAALRRRKYEVWLIREFRTSKSCSKCHHADTNCEPYVFKEKARHGLLCCKNKTCKQFHNRNANATSNMIRIVEAARAGEARPADMACAA